MTAKFYAVLTNAGAAKIANAAALGTQIKITKMGLGDGNGTLPTPDPARTALVREVRRAALNSLSVDPANSSQLIAEQIIPENEGGWWIREFGLYDDSDTLIAVANCPETYKPLLAEGSGRTQTVRMIIIVSSTDAVTLKIDPAVVLATRQYVDNALIEVRQYADSLMADHLKAADPHGQYLKVAGNLAEIKAAGPAAVAATLASLGLGSAAKKTVGNSAGQIPDMSNFATYGSPGIFSAIDIASKMRILEGKATLQFTNGVSQLTLPLAFPSGAYSVVVCDSGSGLFLYSAYAASAGSVNVWALDGTGARLNGNGIFKYIAMGAL